VLTRDGEPALWWVSQEYVGPDGVMRARATGFAAAVGVTPYAERVVPRTSARTQRRKRDGCDCSAPRGRSFEPIFLLHDGPARKAAGAARRHGGGGGRRAQPGLADRRRRRDGEAARPLRDAHLLIADGHHRYETAVTYAEEAP